MKVPSQEKSATIEPKNIYERIKYAYDRSGLSKAEFGRKAKLSKSYATQLAKAELQNIDIPDRTLLSIASALNVSFGWLKTGQEFQGPRMMEYEEDATITKLVSIMKAYPEIKEQLLVIGEALTNFKAGGSDFRKDTAVSEKATKRRKTA